MDFVAGMRPARVSMKGTLTGRAGAFIALMTPGAGLMMACKAPFWELGPRKV